MAQRQIGYGYSIRIGLVSGQSPYPFFGPLMIAHHDGKSRYRTSGILVLIRSHKNILTTKVVKNQEVPRELFVFVELPVQFSVIGALYPVGLRIQKGNFIGFQTGFQILDQGFLIERAAGLCDIDEL